MVSRSIVSCVSGFVALICFSYGASAAKEFSIEMSSVIFQGAGEKIEVVDGDTIWIGIHQVRLHGIDAFESDQICLKGEQNTNCHEQSVAYLIAAVRDPRFQCEVLQGKQSRPKMSYGRYVAICSVGKLNLNRDLVKRGLVYASNQKQGFHYRELEREAKNNGVGLHGTKHEKPWIHRKRPERDCPKDETSRP